MWIGVNTRVSKQSLNVWLCSRNNIEMALKVPYPNLQEKLNQVLMEKKKESSRSGMEIMNLLQVICL
jgi:hypothetical protein